MTNEETLREALRKHWLNVLEAFAATAPKPEPPTFGWLIEIAGPQWLCGFGFSASWTKDSLEAIRFSRRVDAEKIAEVLENCDISITEHQWG
jgi:hypothetical protein